MSENDRPMVEGVAPRVFEGALKKGDAVQTVTREMLSPKDSEKKTQPPDGCVTRMLNFRDRNLIVGACRVYAKGERGKYKGQFKVDSVVKLMSFDETTEYYNMINDAQAENLFRWQEQRQAYVAFRAWKGGMMKVEDLIKQFPDLDLDECPEKPKVDQPRLTPDEERGPAREFHIPSRLDTFIQDALRDMDWSAVSLFGSEFVVDLMTKYGFKAEGD